MLTFNLFIKVYYSLHIIEILSRKVPLTCSVIVKFYMRIILEHDGIDKKSIFEL